jgi:hypothetical protein
MLSTSQSSLEDEVALINKMLSNKEYRAEGKINEGSYG